MQIKLTASNGATHTFENFGKQEDSVKMEIINDDKISVVYWLKRSQKGSGWYLNSEKPRYGKIVF